MQLLTVDVSLCRFASGRPGPFRVMGESLFRRNNNFEFCFVSEESIFDDVAIIFLPRTVFTAFQVEAREPFHVEGDLPIEKYVRRPPRCV